MNPRRQDLNCKFSTTPLSCNYQKRFEHKGYQTKCRKMTRKPRRHDRILMYRTWAILMGRWSDFLCACNTMTNKSEKRYLNNALVNSTSAQLPPGYCGAFARFVSPGGGVFANFTLPGGRAFANPRAIPELLTRTRFPFRM